MKIYLTILVMLLMASVCFGEWTNLSWDILYDGSALPNATGAISYSDGSLGAFTGTTPENLIVNQTYGGVYRMSTVGTNFSAYWSKALSGVPAAISPNSATGYTVELRIKINDLENTAGPLTFSMEEATTGVTRYWLLSFKETLNTDGTTTMTAGISTTAAVVYQSLGSSSESRNWHTYRITATNSGVSLYIDDDMMAVDTLSAYGATSLNNVRFGDLTTTNDGDWEIDYIGIYSGGAIANCSDAAHPYSKGDINKDCTTNMLDLDIFVQNWLAAN